MAAVRLAAGRAGAGTLLFCAALAGCGDAAQRPVADGIGPRPGKVEPARAVLYQDTLTVEMSDRSFCTGPRGRQGPAWRGQLQGCPHLWPFQASLPPERVARLVLQRVGAGPALVEIAAPGGMIYRYGGAR